MSKTYTPKEILGEVAKLVKSKIAEHEAYLENLRKKELEIKAGKKLVKAELCLICAESEFNCSCLKKSAKAEMSTGYAHKVGITSNSALSAHNGKGYVPFADRKKANTATALNHMANNTVGWSTKKTEKAQMPSSSASAMAPTKEHNTPSAKVNKEIGGFKSIAGKSPFSVSSGGQRKASAVGSIEKKEGADLEKKTPPDISEKTMHKLKDEYGHDKAGKEKAYATAWSIENKMKKDDSVGGPEPMAMGEKCEKCGMEKSLCKCMGKTEDVSVPSQKSNPGSGGETKEVGLRKDAMDPHGVGGKQPVGQDGGGVNKVAPGLSGTHQPSPPHKVLNSMSPKHVDAAAKIAQIRGGSKWLSATHSKATRVSPKVAAPASQRFHGALPLQRNEIK